MSLLLWHRNDLGPDSEERLVERPQREGML